MMSIDAYATLVFDCDGVVLNSNLIKTEAFRTAALPWGEAAANALVEHHVSNGGVSRYKKFDYFLDHIVPQHAQHTLPDERDAIIKKLLNTYAAEVRAGLISCTVAEGIQELRAATRDASWLIVSGGDQVELREIFGLRGLDRLFDGGIFGSPSNKDTILASKIESGAISRPGLFVGDSRYDHEAAARAGLDFIFAYAWTEFKEWEEYVMSNCLGAVRYVGDLISDNRLNQG
jgi:phosphoglycolate phosphatase-like HAD superfamily hydrolase